MEKDRSHETDFQTKDALMSVVIPGVISALSDGWICCHDAKSIHVDMVKMHECIGCACSLGWGGLMGEGIENVKTVWELFL